MRMIVVVVLAVQSLMILTAVKLNYDVSELNREAEAIQAKTVEIQNRTICRQWQWLRKYGSDIEPPRGFLSWETCLDKYLREDTWNQSP